MKCTVSEKIYALASSHDSNFLAAGGLSGSIYLWEVIRLYLQTKGGNGKFNTKLGGALQESFIAGVDRWRFHADQWCWRHSDTFLESIWYFGLYKQRNDSHTEFFRSFFADYIASLWSWREFWDVSLFVNGQNVQGSSWSGSHSIVSPFEHTVSCDDNFVSVTTKNFGDWCIRTTPVRWGFWRKNLQNYFESICFQRRVAKCLWTKSNHEPIYNFQRPSVFSIFLVHVFRKSICSLSLSFDGLLLLSGSLDNTCKVWNSQTRQLLRTFEQHHGLNFFHHLTLF